MKLLRRIALDVSAVRESRDFRLLSVGQVISGLGTQAALVALPYQVFVESKSATLVGLLGAFELGPMVVVSLVGGAMLDRVDRRRVLVVAQLSVITIAGLLCAITLAGRPPVWSILILGGLLGGGSSLDNVSRGSIVPGVLGPERLRSGLAFNYGLSQAASIVGPALGGLLIAPIGVAGVYAFDAASVVGMLGVALAIGPQAPTLAATATATAADPGQVRPPAHLPVRRAIAQGLRFVASNNALAGSFAIDINAMAFGMPRALFAVLSLTVYHAGAGGTGLLYAAIAAGGTLSVFTSGWVAAANKLGRILIAVVILWGAAILGAGLVRSIVPAVGLLAAAGWADGISAVCRSTISQSVTPDHMRGRMSSLYSLVVTSGPRLGDIESGLVAGLVGALNSVVIGGAGCLVGVGVVVLAFPELARYDADAALASLAASQAAPETVSQL